MIGRLGQLSEPRLRQQAGIEKISDTCRKGYSCPMGEKDGSRFLRLFCKRRPHFTPELHKTDLQVCSYFGTRIL